jgi:hypothetical protein
MTKQILYLDGACLAIADGATEPTIHIQLAAVHDVEATATVKEFIDTKFTVDKDQYSGNCTLCGERRHCRMKSYEHDDKINLVNYSYFMRK